MFKNPKVRAGIFIALAALFVWIYVDSQREPDYVAEALKQVPAECEVTGVWRDTQYPDQIVAQWKNTTIMCEAAGSRHLITVFDSRDLEPHTATLNENNAVDNRDFYTVNADGTLTIADDFGPVKTLPVADN